MKLEKTNRGFEWIGHPDYLTNEPTRLVSQSSVIGNYEDSVDRPGSSFLWIGPDHHLNREEVTNLIAALQSWVETGSLS